MKEIRNTASLLIMFILLAILYQSSWYIPADQWMVRFFEAIRSPVLSGYFIFFTEFGSGKIIFPILMAIALVLAYKGKAMEALFLFLCFFGSRFFNWLLKNSFDRDRPSFNPLMEENTYSFPSGHAMNSAALFAFAGFLLIRFYPKYQLAIWRIMFFIIASISISRVYIGVHYVSDISAGICAGLIWFIAVKRMYMQALVKFRQK
ncbi:phosphatase PAP2 family protein [Bacillus sp. FJAT-42376]|uniref:phosphatase PAP2 family protein n=1 Tax=Bacillus sp. FJAT-42376 TaxID=2014076 RepID=UPI000F4D7BB4|nr:phosphatase PAP2 family protein [Bacillus sp. FJAT-42376]AZB43204.1 phosphatase PAP2 family protein [Bacillus sp. FJAT-42376]